MKTETSETIEFENKEISQEEKDVTFESFSGNYFKLPLEKDVTDTVKPETSIGVIKRWYTKKSRVWKDTSGYTDYASDGLRTTSTTTGFSDNAHYLEIYNEDTKETCKLNLNKFELFYKFKFLLTEVLKTQPIEGTRFKLKRINKGKENFGFCWELILVDMKKKIIGLDKSSNQLVDL